MKYQDLTKDDIDQKILSFQDRIKSDKGFGHNLYYICTVDKDDNICEERYGVNLMTNRGFAVLHYNPTNIQSIVIGTGYMNSDYETRHGTDGPVLHETHMGQAAALSDTFTQNKYLVSTGYDDMNDTNNGVIYQIQYVGYGSFDYTIQLTQDIDSNTYPGGAPNSLIRDPRWLTDENGDYFNISEIGIFTSGINSDRPSISSYPLYDKDIYDSITNDQRTRQILAWNPFFHFLTLDYDGTFSPIKKRNTQKLIIHVYNSYLLSEKYIDDRYTAREYILMAPIAGDCSQINSLYITPHSCDKNFTGWKQGLGVSNEITDRTKSIPKNYGGYVASTTLWDADSAFSGGLPWDTNEYGPSNGSGVTANRVKLIDYRIIEDPYLYVSHYLISNKYRDSSASASFDDTANTISLQLYETLNNPDNITCSEVYTNNTETLKFDQAFHVTDTTRNIALYRHGVIPCMHLDETIPTPTQGYYFNYLTKQYDIQKTISIPSYFYPQDKLIDCLVYNKIICPDHVMHNVLVYLNPFAENGPHPGMTISSFNISGVTIYATDKYWDPDSWVAFSDTTNTSSQSSNGHLLVQMKYFIRIADTFSNGTSTQLDLTFIDADFPTITSETDPKVLINYDNDGRYFQLDEAVMVGNDDWFTISRSTVVVLDGDVGKDSSNTLHYSAMYRPACESLRMDNQMHQATGYNLAYRVDNSPFINMTSIRNYPTSQVIACPYRLTAGSGYYIDSKSRTYGTLYMRTDSEKGDITSKVNNANENIGTLRHHFITGHNQYTGDQQLFDQNDTKFMIINEPTFTNDLLTYPPTITIIDTTIAIDLDADHQVTETSYTFKTSDEVTEYDFEYGVITSGMDESAISTINRKKLFMKADKYISVSAGDIIMPIFRIDSGTVAATIGTNDLQYTSYGYANYWAGITYDENHIKVGVIERRNLPYAITDNTVKYVRVISKINNDDDPNSNTISPANRHTSTKMYDNPIGIYMIKNHNYGMDMPYIENAQYGTCIRSSYEYWQRETGYGKHLMVYNDCSSETEPYQTWHVIDMNDPVDGNGDPNIIQSFDLDPQWIGTGNDVITGTIGFSHYMYIRMKASDGNYQIIMYDIENNALQTMDDFRGFDYGWQMHNFQFTSTEDILCFAGMRYMNDDLVPYNNAPATLGSNVYCILEQDPTNIRTLYHTDNASNFKKSSCGLQLKYVDWGIPANPKKQLLLAISTSYRYTDRYSYTNRTVLDIGKWINDGEWKIDSDVCPILHWNPTNTRLNSQVSPIYIYKKGVIQVQNMNMDAHTLEYQPLEYFLPMQITVATDTINAYNNPIRLSGLGFKIEATNHLETFHQNLEYNGTNIDHTNTI